MSIVLKISLHGTHSKTGQLQKQWVHILKTNKINFKYKGCYQSRNSPKITDLFPKIDVDSLQTESCILQNASSSIHFFTFKIHTYTKKERNGRKIKVHSCSRLKRKTVDIPLYITSLEPSPLQCLSTLLFLTL